MKSNNRKVLFLLAGSLLGSIGGKSQLMAQEKDSELIELKDIPPPPITASPEFHYERKLKKSVEAPIVEKKADGLTKDLVKGPSLPSSTAAASSAQPKLDVTAPVKTVPVIDLKKLDADEARSIAEEKQKTLKSPEPPAPEEKKVDPSNEPKPADEVQTSVKNQVKKQTKEVVGQNSEVKTLGAPRKQIEPIVERINDDEGLKDSDIDNYQSGKPMFFIGEKVYEPTPADQLVKFVYVSRGAWLLDMLEPLYDKLAIRILRDMNQLTLAGFIEVSRTFVRLSKLIATDDGSKDMARAIALSLAQHRKSVTTLALNWRGGGEEVRVLLKQYVDVTFLKGIDTNTIRIPAGSFKASEFKSLQEVDDAGEGEAHE
ncbi:MAG: hypothetical protein EOP06_01610 [Proteobacteria bacterium]|nr:MAG: hypothetical protein EOP06_01610 [Pseudomonadota bacterium]